MALKATIYKVDLQVNDFNRDHYHQYALNLALHPSEKVERMLTRVLAFCCFANEDLQFTKGLSTDEEPDLWQKSLSDEIECWIDLGLPEERRLKKAQSLSKEVVVFAYGGQKVDPWYESLKSSKLDHSRLRVYKIDSESFEELASHLPRTCELDCMLQDDVATFTLGDISITVSLEQLN